MSAGDVHSVEVARGFMSDGGGREVTATIARIWVEGPSEGDLVMTAEISVARVASAELDGLRDFLQPYLAGFGLGDLA